MVTQGEMNKEKIGWRKYSVLRWNKNKYNKSVITKPKDLYMQNKKAQQIKPRSACTLYQ